MKRAENNLALKNASLVIAGLIFLLVAAAHAYRLFYQFPVLINTTLVPVWVNAVGLGIALLLAVWMFYAAKSIVR